MTEHALTATRPDIRKGIVHSSRPLNIEKEETTMTSQEERSLVTTAMRPVTFLEIVKKRENQETRVTTETKATQEEEVREMVREMDIETDKETVKELNATTVRSSVTSLETVQRRDSQEKSLSVTTVGEWVIWLELVMSKKINFSYYYYLYNFIYF